jgi:glycosyltransferase involved in cell wall biosynthesis
MMKSSVTVIIPCFNEAKTIENVVTSTIQIYPDFEVIVVDDGSKDETSDIAARAGATVICHPYNKGNGAAIKTGIRNAKGDLLVFMDADGQHDPHDIAKLLQYFPVFDMVVGARQGFHQASFLRQLGNGVYNLLAAFVAKFPIQDLTSGFRAAKADVMKKFLYLLPNTYSYPTTSTLCFLRSGLSVKYVHINVSKRQGGKSNIRIARDGIRFFLIIVRICTLFSPFRIFLPVSFGTFLLGLFYYAYTYFNYGRFTNMSALLITTAIIIFMIGLVSEQICQLMFSKSETNNKSQT